jgi:hypothetical protein
MVGLEQRIASALSEEIASTDVATLITETEAAIVAADTTAKVEREKALDPVLTRSRHGPRRNGGRFVHQR